eukprot:CAMPEP_0197036652 /NCGR_PEP_ID=MMETSP1384-20130603/14098_1 /TAXON_ID=29189 /ORGANISM="Ammonia sp." /LENGTH=662 /DNA_ID=CAMNT_0042466849 /DNA_START=13 /DNA_END=2001 /DNA_ORIENTATION=+
MGSFFTKEEELEAVVNQWAIRKEGYLYKQSRHLSSWRRRWTVLHQHYLCTFVRQQSYTSPTEQIDLREFNGIEAPKYEQDVSAWCISLTSSNQSIFRFRHNDQQEIQQWYDAINRSIHANTANLICELLPAELITGHIACYLIGYERFQIFPLLNKHFADLFDLKKFDFSGVYFSDSLYFVQHFARFCNGNNFALKGGLYRAFYNPQQQYNDIYIDKQESQQLLYLLIAYGSLIHGTQQFDQAQREQFREAQLKHTQQLLLRHKPQRRPHKDSNHYSRSTDMKEEEEEYPEEEETKDDETKDDEYSGGQILHKLQSPTFTDIEAESKEKEKTGFEYEYNERQRKFVKTKYSEMPQNLTILDFSRHVSSHSKLVALTFSEVRNEDDDESRMLEQTEVVTDCDCDDNEETKQEGEEGEEKEAAAVQPKMLELVTKQSNEPQFTAEDVEEQMDGNQHVRKDSVIKYHHDVKFLCNLLRFAHPRTFEQIHVLDLSHNAWDEMDVILMSEAILHRNSALNVQQMKLDGIPMSNEVSRSSKAVKKLFQAIGRNCVQLTVLSLNHCMLRDESCSILKQFYENNPNTKLSTLYLINNNITERGVDMLNGITRSNETLAFVVGSFFNNFSYRNRWNMSIIKTDDDYQSSVAQISANEQIESPHNINDDTKH